MKLRAAIIGAVTLSALALSAAAPALAETDTHGGRPLTATLSGANELTNGDPTGTGSAIVRINPGLGEICYTLTVSGLEGTVVAAHIHIGPASVNGPVVVPLAAPVSGSSSACVTVSTDLAHDIVNNPSGYYVNVHTSVRPGGAIRGQLE